MKKFFGILLVFVFAICLTGCGKEDKESVLNKLDKEVNNVIKCCTVDNIIANNMLILKRKEATQM